MSRIRNLTPRPAHMLVVLICAIAFIGAFSRATAIDCESLKDSGDGVPAEYFIHECKGKQALLSRNGKVAEEQFRKALAVRILDAPNYELKVELAEALCMQGRTDEARREIADFQCIAGVDLSEIECPVKAPTSKQCAAMCDGFGSGLNEKGRKLLLSKKAQARSILASCSRANTSVEVDVPKTTSSSNPSLAENSRKSIAADSYPSVPPTYPLTEVPAPTLKKAPVNSISMGSLVIQLEDTLLNDVFNKIGVDRLQHRGDASESVSWLCYFIPSSTNQARM